MLDEDYDYLNALCGSTLRLHSTSPLGDKYYTPNAPPFISQILGLFTKLHNKSQFDAVVGWYFEPYGMSAALIGALTGLPCYVKHAGSDIGRLAADDDLLNSYRAVIGSRSTVLTSGRHFERMKDFGFHDDRIVLTTASRLPDWHFRPPAIDLESYSRAFPDWLSRAIGIDWLRQNAPSSESAIDMCLFGKVGRFKGSMALLDALDSPEMDEFGLRIFVAASGRPQSLRAFYRRIMGSDRLQRIIHPLPPLPPWRVPALLRLCQAALFLEQDFPIAFHTPVVMREIICAGTALIASRQAVARSFLSSNLCPSRNFYEVPDINDTASLRGIIVDVISNEERRRSIATHGAALSRYVESEFPEIHPFVSAMQKAKK